jgi:hypothetical protein
MAKTNTLRKFHSSAVAMAKKDATHLQKALVSASAPGSPTTPADPAGDGISAVGDTPSGITVDYEGPEEGDIPVGALTDSQVVALIKNILLQPAAPFFYRFHNQIFLRVARAN